MIWQEEEQKELQGKKILHECNEGLETSYPEVTYKTWGNYRRTVRAFVKENSDRINQELIDKVMSLWQPQIPVTEVHEVSEVIVESRDERESILNKLLKNLFHFR